MSEKGQGTTPRRSSFGKTALRGLLLGLSIGLPLAAIAAGCELIVERTVPQPLVAEQL